MSIAKPESIGTSLANNKFRKIRDIEGDAEFYQSKSRRRQLRA